MAHFERRLITYLLFIVLLLIPFIQINFRKNNKIIKYSTFLNVNEIAFIHGNIGLNIGLKSGINDFNFLIKLKIFYTGAIFFIIYNFLINQFSI